ncbi:MAG: HD-GYP domain-containing protein [Carbonactinosporaceae bacterium]
MATLPTAARGYVALVVLAALGFLTPLPWAVGVDWVTVLVLTALWAAFEWISTFRVGPGSVSLGFPVALAGVILLPPSAVALVGLLGAIAYHPAPLSLVKITFNGAQVAVSAACSGLVYAALGGVRELGVGSFPEILLPVAGAASAYCLVNGLLVAGVMRAAERVPLITVWRSMLSGSIVAYLGYGLIGLTMAALWQTRFGPFAAVLVLLPLFVARWAFAQYAQEQAAYDATVRALVQAVETKDRYTRGHSERVAAASAMIAREIGMRDDRVESLRYAGILHDVGKLGVPTRVLQKNGPLTPEEYEAIQLHPMRGIELVREIDFLGEAQAGIMHHHEKLDGTGYPMGLSGEQIPEFARVIAVADAFDSMTSTRSYRNARSVEAALREIDRCAGAHFDPAMVAALRRAVAEHGWQRSEALPRPSNGAPVTRYDHDDPTAAVPVVTRSAGVDGTGLPGRS